MVSALLSVMVLSAAPSGLAELHDALEEQATLPAATAQYPRAEMGRSDAVERVRELANEHAKASTAQLKEHGNGNANGNGNGAAGGNGNGKNDDASNAAGNAAASAQGQARANQVRKNPGKPPKQNGPNK
ncbi:MAG: hypothetical protein QM723_14950 [Myxococcaceae bacterium]